jgi:hypothetical protein
MPEGYVEPPQQLSREERRIAELEAALADVRRWQDEVCAEVAAHPGLPCSPEELSIDYVPAILATMAGRIDHADDHQPLSQPEGDGNGG